MEIIGTLAMGGRIEVGLDNGVGEIDEIFDVGFLLKRINSVMRNKRRNEKIMIR
jgi:hypothetical protein